jgi:FixJ family two-component response regulator
MTYIKSLPNPDKPADAFAAVSSLRVLANQLERSTVKEAIVQGWTWAQIAEALDITRQAAHKRHAAFINSKGK